MAEEKSRERVSELRQRAEVILAEDPQAIRTMATADIQKLIQELNVYQIELEMQNEELRRVQLELQETRDKYLDLYDFAPTGYFTLDRNSLIVEVNFAGSELLGSEKSGLIGTQFTASISPDSQDAFYFHYREALKTSIKSTCELKMLKRDGTPFHAQLISTAVPDKDGNINHCRTAVIDITERKKAEEELKLRAEMLDQASDGIMLRDFDGNLLYANETAIKDRGYTQEEFFKLNTRDLVAEPTGRVEGWWQEVREKGYRHTEYNIRHKDGTLVPMDTMYTMIKAGDKEYVLSVTRNITERKKAEKERAELERKAEVASRLASVGEMASGIAHEINNPLTGVVGFAQLLADRKDLPEDVREQLKVIHEGGQRVSNIIQRLLSFARQSKPKRIYLNINEVIERTIALRQYELKTSSIELIKQFDPDLPWTMADAGQLQQVFINLIVNAEQEISKTHGKGRLEVKTELAGDMIRISFKDDGSGISKENIGRLFDPFFTTKDIGKGTGLGLSLSHGIIAEHGGQLYAESKPGKGATFVVELPVLVEEEEVKEIKDETEEVVKGRILVVDDEEIVRHYLDRVLTKMGHSVELVSDGEEALKRVKATRYGLILLDIKMPGMDGKEFYRRVGEIALSITKRVVFITGDVMGEDTRDFLLKTGVLYVTKPFDDGRLSWVVNRVLGGSKGEKTDD